MLPTVLSAPAWPRCSNVTSIVVDQNNQSNRIIWFINMVPLAFKKPHKQVPEHKSKDGKTNNFL